MEYHCSTCNEKVDGDLLVFVDHTETHIVDEIKLKHPKWVTNDGVCTKCFEYYKNQIKGGS